MLVSGEGLGAGSVQYGDSGPSCRPTGATQRLAQLSAALAVRQRGEMSFRPRALKRATQKRGTWGYITVLSAGWSSMCCVL